MFIIGVFMEKEFMEKTTGASSEGSNFISIIDKIRQDFTPYGKGLLVCAGIGILATAFLTFATGTIYLRR
jgi:hypothetical protein